ncbi:hypothetical protein [Conexivisphaera calida]|nr:hypothetical protein [Conexivisphaera calida]
MSGEDVWEYDEDEWREVPGWTGHSAVDGTAPPDLNRVLGRQVGRTESHIIRAAHAERNADAKGIVREVAPRLNISGRALDRVLELVDRAKDGSARERAVAALYAARAAPIGALVDALVEAGLMDGRDEYYPFRTAYRCGLSPGPMDAATAANVYSIHRLPRTGRELARHGLLDAADRFIRKAIAEAPVEGGRTYRARAVAALHEIDRQLRGVVLDWGEVDEKW